MYEDKLHWMVLTTWALFSVASSNHGRLTPTSRDLDYKYLRRTEIKPNIEQFHISCDFYVTRVSLHVSVLVQMRKSKTFKQ